MKSIFDRRVAAAAMVLAMPFAESAAHAGGTSSGAPSWTGQSHVVGTMPTASTPTTGGGNPIYHPDSSVHSGVASLIMSFASGAQNICTGSLAPDRQSIITAAHCVGAAGGTVKSDLLSVTAYFHDGSLGPNAVVHETPTAAVGVTDLFVNPLYTGDMVDENDIAVLRLANLAPSFAKSYALDFSGDLTGRDYGFAGYGFRSTVGGDAGYDASFGMLRQGQNSYDFRLGDATFGDTWSTILGRPASQIDDVYFADFDSGFPINDVSCNLTTALFGTNSYCGLGRGALEASTAPGDSGGPQFVDGKLASISSFGVSFGTGWGDADAALDSSFGELNGLVPLYIHEQFILSHLVASVPEPATWLQMIAGFALLGGLARRSVRTKARLALA